MSEAQQHLVDCDLRENDRLTVYFDGLSISVIEQPADAATVRPWAELIEQLKAHNAIAISQQDHVDALALAEAVLHAGPEPSHNEWWGIVKLARKVAGR